MRIKLKRLISVVIIISTILCFSSCSKIKRAIAEKEITSLVTGVFDSYILERNDEAISQLGIELVSLTKEQQDAYRYSLKNASYEINSIDIDDDVSSAKVSLKIDNLADLTKNEILSGTVEEIYAEIKDNSDNSVSVRLKLKKDSDGKWYFSNLEDVVDKLRTPYSEICFLDDNGVPINVTEKYLKKMVVANAWIDPLIGNPIKGEDLLEIESPAALRPAFYFNKPVTLSLTCELKNITTGESYRAEETIADNVFIIFDFTGNENGLSSGEYCCTLYYNDMEIMKSDVITVK